MTPHNSEFATYLAPYGKHGGSKRLISHRSNIFNREGQPQIMKESGEIMKVSAWHQKPASKITCKKGLTIPIGHIPIPKGPFTRITMDYVDIIRPVQGKRYVSGRRLSFSRWVEAVPAKRQNADSNKIPMQRSNTQVWHCFHDQLRSWKSICGQSSKRVFTKN